MSVERQKMLRALKRIVEPRLRELGFSGKSPHYRRAISGLVHTISYQFDKYGGGFVVELGCAEADRYRDLAGTQLAYEKMTPYDLGFLKKERARLGSGDSDVWGFRYDRGTAAVQDAHEGVAREVLNRLNDAIVWLESGRPSRYVAVP